MQSEDSILEISVTDKTQEDIYSQKFNILEIFSPLISSDEFYDASNHDSPNTSLSETIFVTLYNRTPDTEDAPLSIQLKLVISTQAIDAATVKIWRRHLKVPSFNAYEKTPNSSPQIIYNNNHRFVNITGDLYSKRFCSISNTVIKSKVFNCERCNLTSTLPNVVHPAFPICKKPGVFYDMELPDAVSGRPHTITSTQRFFTSKTCSQTGEVSWPGQTMKVCEDCQKTFKLDVPDSYIIDSCGTDYSALKDSTILEDALVTKAEAGLSVQCNKIPYRPKFSINDFEISSKLGSGAFGQVYAAKSKTGPLLSYIKHSEFTAIKVIEKQVFLDYDIPLENLDDEQQVLKICTLGRKYEKCNTVSACFGTFQDESRLYFLLEALPNKSLYFHCYENLKTSGPQTEIFCKYYRNLM